MINSNSPSGTHDCLALNANLVHIYHCYSPNTFFDKLVVQKLIINSLKYQGFPDGSEVKVSACKAGDLGLIPESGRSPGEGNGNPLQYSCLENSMDGGVWWATVHGVAKSRTRLSERLN